MQSILYNLVPEKLLQPVRKGKLLDKDGKKNVTVDYIEMSKNESTFSFRNFLTISTTEKFENEIYIDNGFYISRVNKIKTLELVPITKYNKKKDKDEIEYPFSSPKMFYIDL